MTIQVAPWNHHSFSLKRGRQAVTGPGLLKLNKMTIQKSLPPPSPWFLSSWINYGALNTSPNSTFGGAIIMSVSNLVMSGRQLLEPTRDYTNPPSCSSGLPIHPTPSMDDEWHFQRPNRLWGCNGAHRKLAFLSLGKLWSCCQWIPWPWKPQNTQEHI